LVGTKPRVNIQQVNDLTRPEYDRPKSTQIFTRTRNMTIMPIYGIAWNIMEICGKSRKS